jgi:uncharacterized RDD family membrane protein YckC
VKKPEINNSYRISSIGKRTTAYFIDDILVSLLLFVIFYDQLLTIYMGLQNSTDFTPIVNFLEHNSVVFILLRMVYQTFFVWQSGMTVGKRFLKIKVIELEKGEKPQFQVALLRASLRIISDSIFYLGYILAYFNPLVQTLHDKLAKTIVVEL